MNKRKAVLAAGLLAAAVLTACGNQKTGSESGESAVITEVRTTENAAETKQKETAASGYGSSAEAGESAEKSEMTAEAAEETKDTESSKTEETVKNTEPSKTAETVKNTEPQQSIEDQKDTEPQTEPETAGYGTAEAGETAVSPEAGIEAAEEEREENQMNIQIGDTVLTAVLEDNETAAAFRELIRNGGLTVHFSQYGGFEQVGSIGTKLSRKDVQMTTSAGDIVLYSGNQLVMFYGSNSWAYTRIGRIDSVKDLKNILGKDSITATFTLAE